MADVDFAIIGGGLNGVDAAARGASIRTGARCVWADRSKVWKLTVINRGMRETVTARAPVNASGAWTRRVAETVLHLPAVRASFTKVSQIVVRRIFDRDTVYVLQNDDRRMIYAIPFQRDFTLIGSSERGFDGDPAMVSAGADDLARIDRILGAAKSMDDLGPVFGDDLTGAEVRYLMREEFVRFADDILWRRSKLCLTMSRQDRGALATFMAAA
jgi:glycerol-3-phosphate dehydrogenase